MIDALIGGGIACKYFVKTLSYFWEQILVEVGIFFNYWKMFYKDLQPTPILCSFK